ncbi:MAG: pilus assembly protein TadG-related protein, partial [Pirellula sp.]|nr:pilus assembly protein TadG-related protein [Pirellula sp.]
MNISSRTRFRKRKGSVTVLFMVVLPALLILSAVAINIAYLQLSRTELMVASDLAAHAGGRALSANQSIESARDHAIRTAALNRVAGRPLDLGRSSGANEIEFGVSAQTSNSAYSKFQFSESNSASARRMNAIRINAKQEGIAVYFPGLMPISSIKTGFSTVSMQVDRDIALVFDRSGSMRFFEQTWPRGTDPRSPAALNAATDAGILIRTVRSRDRNGNPTSFNYSYARGQDQDRLDYFLWNEHFKITPPALTPWEKLVNATETFVGLLSETPNEEMVSVTTYASNARNDLPLSENYVNILDNLRGQDINGATAIGTGMM